MLSIAVKSRYGNKRPIKKFFLTRFRLHFIETRSTHKENRQGNAENRLKIPTDLHPTGLYGNKSISIRINRRRPKNCAQHIFHVSKAVLLLFYLYVHLRNNE